MKRVFLVFVTSFGVAASLGLVGVGCAFDDCHCPDTPARPDPQGPLGNLTVSMFDQQGALAEPPVVPVNGAVQVTGDTLVFRYEQDGLGHEIVYEVVDEQ